jgi:hypothetical protein
VSERVERIRTLVLSFGFVLVGEDEVEGEALGERWLRLRQR